MFALVDALDDWRHYLFGADIQIFTDNSALRYLQNTARHSSVAGKSAAIFSPED